MKQNPNELQEEKKWTKINETQMSKEQNWAKQKKEFQSESALE